MTDADETDDWDECAAGWDDDEAARAYATAAYESLTTLLSHRGVSLDGGHVLDFGCGTGLLSEKLIAHGARIAAVDTSPAMRAVLEAKAAANGWTGIDVRATLPAEGQAYDLVVCSSVCSFLDDYPAAVRRLVSLLAPGGLFVQWDWELDADDPDGHGLTRAQIVDALEAAGLEGIDVGIGFEAAVGSETMRPLMGHGATPSTTTS